MRLGAGRDPHGRYRAIEAESRNGGVLTPAGLVEQTHLALEFARDAWSGLTTLRAAGKEGRWTLSEAEAGGRGLAASERETLEVAQEIGSAIERLDRTHSERHGDRSPSALEEAGRAAEALRGVGPITRTAAGWPGSADAPDARRPEDIARIAAIADTLYGEIRSIANRLIAGWIAEAQVYGKGRAT